MNFHQCVQQDLQIFLAVEFQFKAALALAVDDLDATAQSLTQLLFAFGHIVHGEDGGIDILALGMDMLLMVLEDMGGDFLYAKEEIEQMAMEIEALKAAGADGFVIGCLTADGDLDREAMKPLLEVADGAGLTLHRCIDVSRDLCKTYRDAAALGIDTILTSGAASSCMQGMETMMHLSGECSLTHIQHIEIPKKWPVFPVHMKQHRKR